MVQNMTVTRRPNFVRHTVTVTPSATEAYVATRTVFKDGRVLYKVTWGAKKPHQTDAQATIYQVWSWLSLHQAVHYKGYVMQLLNMARTDDMRERLVKAGLPDTSGVRFVDVSNYPDADAFSDTDTDMYGFGNYQLKTKLTMEGVCHE